MPLALTISTFVSAPASATLGGNAASVTADQVALQATLVKNLASGYTDYALALTNGIVVHEFVNSADKVFEVTWNGKGMRPDMKQLLGTYFSQIATQPKKGRPTLRQADSVNANFEMHSSVRNRIFSGTAHIPSNVPASLTGVLSVPNDNIKTGAVKNAASN